MTDLHVMILSTSTTEAVGAAIFKADMMALYSHCVIFHSLFQKNTIKIDSSDLFR